MYKITYIWDENNLGSSISHWDDIFMAMREGEEKAKEIAKALKVKIKTIEPGDIEIRCFQYSPQMLLDPMFNGTKKDSMTRIPGSPTLKSLRT